MKTPILIMALGLMVAFQSQADLYRHLDETFESGATFSGDLIFTDSGEQITSVDGWLTGANYGNQHFTWVWSRFNFAGSGSYPYSCNFLMDGTGNGRYHNFMTITWNYNDMTLAGDSLFGFGNNVGYRDHYVSGSFNSILDENDSSQGRYSPGTYLPDGGCTMSLLGGALVVLGAWKSRKSRT